MTRWRSPWGRDGRLIGARLSDGDLLEADVAVVALGGIRNVEWLDGSGLRHDRAGVVCDGRCRAVDDDGGVDPAVHVAGDVARFPHPLADGELVAVEHWGNAVDQAVVAAHNMVHGDTDPTEHTTLPVFWSNQFGVNLKLVGLPGLAEHVTVTQGDVDALRFVAAYGHDGRTVAALALDTPRALDAYAALIESRGAFPPPFAPSDEPTRHEVFDTGPRAHPRGAHR